MRTEPMPKRLLIALLLGFFPVAIQAQEATPTPTPPPAVPPPVQAPAAPEAREMDISQEMVEVQKAVEGVSALRGNRTIASDETVDDDVVTIGGDLRVFGTIAGDAVVANGDLILEDGGRIEGDALVTGGDLVDRGGTVLGEMRTLSGGEVVHNGRGRHLEREQAVRIERGWPGGSWFAPIGRGFAGLISTFALALVLGGIGAAVIFYALPYLRRVSETLRVSTARSAAVGVAAMFLVLPVYVALIVLLVITIIGIPVAVIAAFLYPLAVAAALTLGLLAASHLIGERTAERRREIFREHHHAYAYLFAGLVVLLAPLVVANLLTMAGLGFLSTLLKVAIGLVIWAAATVGLGAVVLSRAGTRDTFARPTYAAPPGPAGWDDDLREAGGV